MSGAGGGVAGTRCVGDLHLAPVVTVRPGTTIAEAARVLLRTGAPFVHIEGHDRVFASDDVVRAFADPDDGLDPGADVCSLARSVVLVVTRATPAIAVLGEVARGQAAGVLIIDERREPAGYLRLQDLVASLLDELSLLAGLRHVLHAEDRSW
jgi:CBS domain-containing protein